jgi:hypothetical protein
LTKSLTPENGFPLYDAFPLGVAVLEDVVARVVEVVVRVVETVILEVTMLLVRVVGTVVVGRLDEVVVRMVVVLRVVPPLLPGMHCE